MGFLGRLQQTGGRTHAAATHAGVAGPAFAIWGQRGWPSVDIVGESFYAAAIRAMFGSGKLPEGGEELLTDVLLVHDHLNVHDRNAVEVRGETGLLGYLSRENAAIYAPMIDQIQGRGLVATTGARVWARDETDWETGKPAFMGSVRVDLPAPHMMFPQNQQPAELHRVLPYGSAIRVTTIDRENADATGPYLCLAGECWVYATIHEVVDHGPRSSKGLAEVRIDGRPVGRLTPKLSSDMLPVVQYLSQRGFATAVRAIVRGNQLKSEVVVHAVRATDLPQEWVDTVPIATSVSPEPPSAFPLIVAPGGTSPVPPVPATTATANDDLGVVAAFSAPGPGPATLTGSQEVRTAAIADKPVASWYPDPHHIARLRWWDGARWTEHIVN